MIGVCTGPARSRRHTSSPVDARQHEVEHDQIESILLCRGKPGVTVERELDLAGQILQMQPHEVSDVLLVFDHQYAAHLTLRTSGLAPAAQKRAASFTMQDRIRESPSAANQHAGSPLTATL